MDLYLAMHVDMKICVLCGCNVCTKWTLNTYNLLILHLEYLLQLS